MLDLLHVRGHDEGAGRNHRASEFRGGGPAPEPEHQEAGDGRAAPNGTTQRALRFLMYHLLHHAAPAATGFTADGEGTGRSTLRSTSSRGPNALASPWAITSTWSTVASALGRCAITIASPPRARTPAMACVRACSPSASRFEFGSSSTTKNGLP